MSWSTNEEISIFRQYIRIKSVQPDVDYDECIQFLTAQALSLKLPIRVYPVEGDARKPIAVITWQGSEPQLPSIVLNSHMDVVPVLAEQWTHAPFGAELDEEGRIFGRGTQDMKSVGVQYLAAIRALRLQGCQNRRNVHVTFVPDEEIGGFTGMGAFVRSPEFEALNVGFAMDEGIASPDEVYSVFYAERSGRFCTFVVNGQTGHGSLLHENTVGPKISYILQKMYEFRGGELQKLKDNAALTIGDVTSINLTKIEGGSQINVVPDQMRITFDIRLSLDVNPSEFDEMLFRWCQEAGGDIELEFLSKSKPIAPTKMDASNPFWGAFHDGVVNCLGLTIKPQVFTGGTDSRYLRALGIPAIGFSPIINTPVLLHDNDEYLGADTYLRGIEIYKTIISKIANV